MQTKTNSLDALLKAFENINIFAAIAELNGIKDECSNALSIADQSEVATLQKQLTNEQEEHTNTKKDLSLANEEITLLRKELEAANAKLSTL